MRFETWEDDGARTWANWSYQSGDWSGTCVSTNGTSREFSARSPPHWPPTNARDGLVVGKTVRVWYVEDCRIQSLNATYDGVRDGRHEARASGFRTSWDAQTGLVLEWERGPAFGRLALRR